LFCLPVLWNTICRSQFQPKRRPSRAWRCGRICRLGLGCDSSAAFEHTFVDGYCSTVQGFLDWFEADLGFTELLLFGLICVFCVLWFSTPASHSPLVLFRTFFFLTHPTKKNALSFPDFCQKACGPSHLLPALTDPDILLRTLEQGELGDSCGLLFPNKYVPPPFTLQPLPEALRPGPAHRDSGIGRSRSRHFPPNALLPPTRWVPDIGS